MFTNSLRDRRDEVIQNAPAPLRWYASRTSAQVPGCVSKLVRQPLQLA
jgi:hypothetical protein